MSKKRGVGRPRLPKTKVRSKVISVKVTEKQKNAIIAEFGSIKNFFDKAMEMNLKKENENE